MQKGVVRRVITNGGGVVNDKTNEILISLRILRIKILNTLLHANDPAEQEKKGEEKNKQKQENQLWSNDKFHFIVFTLTSLDF